LSLPTEGLLEREAFDRVIGELRPKLHRYCARMTGSVIDGEDVVQEALLKALLALSHAEPLANPEGWLFRIAHNAALDFLRQQTRHKTMHATEDLEQVATSASPIEDREAAHAALRTFMQLPPAQRSSVILKDVLGYSVEEICDVTGGSIAAVKSALQRGRARVRALAQEPDDVVAPALADADRERLTRYVALFNARDFDAVRDMLADDVRLDLVNRLQVRGRHAVGEYFHRYAQAEQWRFSPGLVEGRAAMLVFDRHDPDGRPAYFVLLEWADHRVAGIRDFLLARYTMESATLSVLG
jgi:RNA polymerase sigma-70 factor, ECF subfamily